MADYREQLIQLIGAPRISPPDRFSWFGEPAHGVSRQARQTIDSETRRHYLVVAVRTYLYERYYLRGHSMPWGDPIITSPAIVNSPFVASLIEANTGNGCWQRDWTLVEQMDDGAWVERDGLTVWAPNALYAPQPLGEASRAVRRARVRVPKGSVSQSPGFYLAYSDTPFELSPDEILVRFYWHITAGGAAKLMSLTTSSLNTGWIPFRFKVLSEPRAYRRNDAGVLYLAKSDLRRSALRLEKIYRAIQPELRPGEPALTKGLAPGLGLAEDPGGGESFGTHRCGILAEALVRAAERGITNPGHVLEVIEECFHNEGLDLDQPYLNPGSRDDYDRILARGTWYITSLPNLTLSTIGEETVSGDPTTAKEIFIEAASAIGDRLIDSAIWHDGRCTWLGELAAQPGHLADFGALGPDVYTGTAGIALFLAQLYGETGNERYAETSRAAMRQSMQRAERHSGPMPIGYYTGWTGIAAVAAQIGYLIGDEDLAMIAPRKLFEHPPEGPSWTEPDIMAGTAGAILACLALARMNSDKRYLNDALKLGDSLLRAAKRRGSEMCWPTSTLAGRRPLAGFAHGAAGIATALLELFVETGDWRFAEAAKAAFVFERRNFSPDLENWIDLRFPIAGSRFGPAAITESHWCHGAAGIAISRLFAWQILGDEAYRTEAEAAIRTTCRWFETEAVNVSGNWTLCHGFPGNADILLTASRLLAEQAPHLLSLANRIGAASLTLDDLPTEPGLMLGQAGLGLFYLRLVNTDTLSPLVPGAIAAGITTG